MSAELFDNRVLRIGRLRYLAWLRRHDPQALYALSRKGHHDCEPRRECDTDGWQWTRSECGRQ